MYKRKRMIVSLVLVLTLIPVLVSALPATACTGGCTPGFWKNHADNWVPTGLSPGDDFDTQFGITTAVGSIMEALNLKGGHFKALYRHAAAAILNASHPGMEYPMTLTEIVALVQNAVASGDWEDPKDMLEGYNEIGCPLS